ncbi:MULTISPECIES: hypothetical protein [Anaerotruncus]|uniref:hypothetical protein n=1 Tax=Anaerotruncus TaxID=244127 RepID=UPI000A6EA914|nr:MULTISPECIES: hypothetical protein [Anaerotruncus]RGX55165.1 hypothetical protein DWV16_10380 [Anaerotruncus sp. AF02-27]
MGRKAVFSQRRAKEFTLKKPIAAGIGITPEVETAVEAAIINAVAFLPQTHDGQSDIIRD